MQQDGEFKIVSLIDDTVIYLNRFDIEKDVISEFIPLSSYYYETFELCLSRDFKLYKNYEAITNFVDKFQTNIIKILISCDDEHKNRFADYIFNTSKEIKNMFRNEEWFPDNFKRDIDFEIDKCFKRYLKTYTIDFDIFDSIKNCVALAYPICPNLRNKTNSYFALSGSSKDYDGSLISGWSMTLSKEYNCVGKLIKSFFGYDFIECHLTDQTRRYTHIDRRKGSRKISDFWGKVLSKPISLATDYKYTFKHIEDQMRPYYSCCERKIASKMDFVNLYYKNLKNGITVINKLSSYIIKVKYEPCKMCRPSIIGCYFIEDGYCSCFDTVSFSRFPKYIDCSPDPYEPLILKTR